MPGIRYKFIRIVPSGSYVNALFTKGPSILFSGVEILESEKGCKEIYHEALKNVDNSRGSYASYNSREDAKEAFYTIRAYKQQHGIPFEVESLA